MMWKSRCHVYHASCHGRLNKQKIFKVRCLLSALCSPNNKPFDNKLSVTNNIHE